jgi:DNA-directed RNA polymerase subunit RPC12/RpoP
MKSQLNKNFYYTCSQCGEKYVIDDMIKFEELLVCFNCKPIFLQKLREGVPISQKISRPKWWKIYFFIILALQLISFIYSFQNIVAGEELIKSILDIVIYPFILVAIFGYSFNKKFLIRKIWQVLFPVAIVADLIFFCMMFAEHDKTVGAIVTVVFLLFVSPLIAFQYIALYRYGFAKTEPWI